MMRCFAVDPYGLETKRKRKEVNVSSYYNERIPTSVLQDVKGLILFVCRVYRSVS